MTENHRSLNSTNASHTIPKSDFFHSSSYSSIYSSSILYLHLNFPSENMAIVLNKVYRKKLYGEAYA